MHLLTVGQMNFIHTLPGLGVSLISFWRHYKFVFPEKYSLDYSSSLRNFAMTAAASGRFTEQIGILMNGSVHQPSATAAMSDDTLLSPGGMRIVVECTIPGCYGRTGNGPNR